MARKMSASTEFNSKLAIGSVWRMFTKCDPLFPQNKFIVHNKNRSNLESIVVAELDMMHKLGSKEKSWVAGKSKVAEDVKT